MRDPSALSDDEIEAVERMSLRWLHRAALDLGFDVADVFQQSTDKVKDVAEDITREMLDRLGGYSIQQRILGNVDYRKARYVIQPDWMIRQALFVDSKAEKTSRTATLQMSQLSMCIRQLRGTQTMDKPGKLSPIAKYGRDKYLTTTLLAHYAYEDVNGEHMLESLTLAAIPNGILQDQYNPDADSTIWLAGRNAPTLGEDFRVRVSFAALEGKRPWRVQRICYDRRSKRVLGEWKEE